VFGVRPAVDKKPSVKIAQVHPITKCYLLVLLLRKFNSGCRM